MLTDHDLIAWSFERLSELHGDPTAAIYARLFARYPELEGLFVLDRGGAVRGNMLTNVFEALLDIAGPRQFGLSFVAAEGANHEAIGVSRAAYLSFFAIVLETVGELLGEEWTPAADAAWRRALAEVETRLGGG